MTDDLGRLARALREGTPADDEQPVDIPDMPDTFRWPDEQHYPTPTYDTPDYVYEPPPEPEPLPPEASAPMVKVLVLGWALLLSMVWPPWTFIIGLVVGIALWANRN